MAGGVHGKAVELANHVSVAIREQFIKLRAIALKFSALVDDFAKGFLDLLDMLPDPNFPTQLALNIGGT